MEFFFLAFVARVLEFIRLASIIPLGGDRVFSVVFQPVRVTLSVKRVLTRCTL